MEEICLFVLQQENTLMTYFGEILHDIAYRLFLHSQPCNDQHFLDADASRAAVCACTTLAFNGKLWFLHDNKLTMTLKKYKQHCPSVKEGTDL